MAIANEWLHNDPFARFKTKLEEVPREFLSADELERIENKEFEITRLDQIRDAKREVNYMMEDIWK